jgi:hypothetical protein
MKIKKMLSFIIVSFLFVGSIIAQPCPPGSPPGCTDGTNTIDTGAPIDGQIWLGLIGGLAIGGYFFMKKTTIKID